ncbi:MAG: hypothetical protein NXI01_01435 [Gammaproteobacteria bacterium]|nr:hypothetical protein [Gammaproteobacteria bacterium]
MNSSKLSAYGLSVTLLWETIPPKHHSIYMCTEDEFYLNIPKVARFLVLALENKIIIEKASDNVPYEAIQTYLHGTILSYLLQRNHYLVLHGAAVLVHGKAVLISGQSGAGKSTAAAQLFNLGYPILADDMLVLNKNCQQTWEILPGPRHVKLWQDALGNLAFADCDLSIIISKGNNVKYKCSLPSSSSYAVPIASFYELVQQDTLTHISQYELHHQEKLKVLLNNSYRYFMLKALNRLEKNLKNCVTLAQQITMKRIIRKKQANTFKELTAKLHKEFIVES